MKNPLQDIPVGIRRAMYILYTIIGVTLGALAIAHVNSVFGADLDTLNDVFIYVGAALGLTAASNAFQTNTAVVAAPGNVTVTDERDV